MITLFLLPLLPMVAADTTIYGCPTCPDLRTVNSDGFLYYIDRPNFLTFAKNASLYKSVDSICTTLQFVPGSPRVQLATETTVYLDGSYDLDFFILVGSSSGLYQASGTTFRSFEYNLRGTSCGTQVGYLCDQCRQEPRSYGFGMSTTYGKIPYSCLFEAEEILAEQNIDDGDTYVFPMTLGPNCYFLPSYYMYSPNPQCHYFGINCRSSIY